MLYSDSFKKALNTTAILHLLITLTSITCAAPLHAQENPPGQVERITTREGVSVPVYALWKAQASASVVLFSGGAGGYGNIAGDGWPAGGNFLIRTGRHWATYPFNIIMIGRPSDGIDLASGSVRTGDLHNADNVAIFNYIKEKSAAPLWLVGTSMGTISAAAAAIFDQSRLVDGVVLSSSITAYKVPGAVPRQELDKIRVPTLILHHQNDACWACQAHETKHIATGLKNAPIKKTLIVSGGSGASGNPCEPLHHHGFIGMQNEAVDLIARWIIQPTE